VDEDRRLLVHADPHRDDPVSCGYPG